MSFHQDLWDGWLNSNLDWGEFDFSGIPGASDQEMERWDSKQGWLLQDKNRFYFPLFGLGNKESDIAFVAAGPGNSVENGYYNETTSGRKRIIGPEKNREHWLNTDQPDKYSDDFNEERRKWKQNRLELHNNDGSHKLTENLEKVIENVEGLGSELYDEVYITNFMKDGEFKNVTRGEGLSKDLSDIEQIPKPDGDRIQYDNANTSLVVAGRWQDLKKRTTKPGKVCELASREFWLPFLGLELIEIDPQLVVPIGRKATEAVYHLYEFEQEEKETPPLDVNGDKIESTLQETLNGQPDVLPSYHWAAQDSNHKMDPGELSNGISDYFE